MDLIELKKRTKALEKSFRAQDNQLAATEGDITAAQSARYDELFDEAVWLRAELCSLGFGVLFCEAAERAQRR